MPKIKVTTESMMKRDFARIKIWLCEMIDQVGWGFHPDHDFKDYVNNDSNPLFDEATADNLNIKMEECFELFCYFGTQSDNDIYSFCSDYLESKEFELAAVF